MLVEGGKIGDKVKKCDIINDTGIFVDIFNVELSGNGNRTAFY